MVRDLNRGYTAIPSATLRTLSAAEQGCRRRLRATCHQRCEGTATSRPGAHRASLLWAHDRGRYEAVEVSSRDALHFLQSQRFVAWRSSR